MINTYLKYLLHEKKYSTHTILSYQNDLLQLNTFLSHNDGNLDLASTPHKVLRSWIVSLIEEKISPRSVNRKIATLRSFYKFLHAREIIDTNPSLKLKPLKTEKPLPEFIQEKEMDYLFDSGKISFGDGFTGLRDKLILELFYGTGIRLSELIGIKDESFSFYNETIKVLGKRNKERIIPLTKEIVNTTRIYTAKRNEIFSDSRDNFLLLTDTGKKCYPMMVYRTVKTYLGYITQSSKKSPHVLRHTFATHL
jgi:integrase/recombinase XerC